MYLAVRRALPSLSSLLYGEGYLDDVCLLCPLPAGKVKLWAPLPPEEYDVSAPPLENAKHYPINLNEYPNAFAIASHTSPPCGLCNISLKAYTIDRYPTQDSPNTYPLPTKELPLFVFPHGIKIACPSVLNQIKFGVSSDNSGQCPFPKFFSFNFTNSDGDFFYVACLRFYEKLPFDALKYLCDSFPFEVQEYLIDKEFFIPKVICVISTFPFYRAMRLFLDQIYSLSLCQSRCSIESFIASLVAALPVPLKGGRAFYFIFDALQIPEDYQTMPPIIFSVPKPVYFPLVDFDFFAPLRCFSVSLIVLLFSLILQESRIVFLGSSSQLITEVMESFRALLFPLQWYFLLLKV